MKKIWKYTLAVSDHPVITMQKGAIILSVDVQHGAGVQVWALVDPEAPTELRRFRVAGTGHPLEEDIELLRFIGTVQMMGGQLVWHIFVHPEAAG